jgi:hypothetical protein
MTDRQKYSHAQTLANVRKRADKSKMHVLYLTMAERMTYRVTQKSGHIGNITNILFFPEIEYEFVERRAY